MAGSMPADRRLPESVGEAAVTDVPTAEPHARAGETRAALAGRRFTSSTEVALLDGERFAGIVPIERLLSSPDDASLGELAQQPPLVLPEADLETVARDTARRGARSAAVVDAAGRFQGFVPPDRLLHVLEAEHEEDLARLGGFLSSVAAARTAADEAVALRLWHRLPWLGLGLVGAMASALVVGAFEDEIRDEVLLALFVPAVVYMADAVGTQTETVVIRGLALGVPIPNVFVRELLTGVLIGTLLGSLFFPFALLVWGDAQVAATVALSLGISCSVATLVAMALPYVLSRLGHDPAFGSGPLATVIQDLLSIGAYFAVALVFVS